VILEGGRPFGRFCVFTLRNAPEREKVGTKIGTVVWDFAKRSVAGNEREEKNQSNAGKEPCHSMKPQRRHFLFRAQAPILRRFAM
jgi:hypothetical protein